MPVSVADAGLSPMSSAPTPRCARARRRDSRPPPYRRPWGAPPHQVSRMFASPAIASTGAPSGGAMSLISILPWVAVFAIMYFLMIRPQQKRMKQHRDMLAAVKKNDVAVTSGGVIGKVVKVEDSEIELEIASGVRVKVVKSMLSEVRSNNPKPAND